MLFRSRQSISHVPQNIFLRDGSIAQNIAFGKEDKEIDFQTLKESADKASILDFIENSVSGFNTFVGERGIRLSGGQKQRIAIARALYRKSEFLVLDESTSSLDYETESKILEVINNLNPNLTIIIVAHRLNTLENCNRIFKISNGHLKRVK